MSVHLLHWESNPYSESESCPPPMSDLTDVFLTSAEGIAFCIDPMSTECRFPVDDDAAAVEFFL